MITLKEAFKPCCIRDDEVVWLYDDPKEPLFGRYPMTGKQIREKYDMQRTSVIKIAPHFIGGDYEGFEFAITKKKARGLKWHDQTAEKSCQKGADIITLKEVFKLCCIRDDEIVWLYDDPKEPLFGRYPMTGKQIREKYDMRRTSVIKIAPHFMGGDYGGFEFAITKKKDER